MKLAYDGAIRSIPPPVRQSLLDRRASFEPALDAVRPIRDDVRTRGDAALRDLTLRFDGEAPEALEVPRAERIAALSRLPIEVRAALVDARRNVERYHRAQLRTEAEVEVVPGVRAGRRFVPVARAGAYVPGGRASYPSTVLMTVLPAKVAGVREVVVCTPPGKGGLVPDATLAACEVAGADRVFAVGGAQAVFAMAYGTATVPRCDKVVGPGNAYVMAAKSLVAGDVAIDSPAGPSEVLVLHLGSKQGEGERDARFAVAEVLAQAEHDPDAACAVVTTSALFVEAFRKALADADAGPRAEVVREALARRGALLLADSADEARAFSDAYAPEHLVILSADPRADLDRLSSYGSAFLGPWSSVALGDYASGPNHVLPTAGLARAYSGLSVDDFLRRPTHQEATREGMGRLAHAVEALAAFEGLPNHAAAVRLRRETR
ncbi:MAG TPA: histidinol dehydrogenase [Candidatus Thermoplasmatota archaeon]|nr:histidinol dehydrogenase [Candidatus Thermoplasmatota archaeon]